MKKIFLLSALFVFAFGGDLFAQDYKKLRKKQLRIEHQKKLNLIDSLSQELNLSNKKSQNLQSDLNNTSSDLILTSDSLKNSNLEITQLEGKLSDSNVELTQLVLEMKDFISKDSLKNTVISSLKKENENLLIAIDEKKPQTNRLENTSDNSKTKNLILDFSNEIRFFAVSNSCESNFIESNKSNWKIDDNNECNEGYALEFIEGEYWWWDYYFYQRYLISSVTADVTSKIITINLDGYYRSGGEPIDNYEVPLEKRKIIIRYSSGLYYIMGKPNAYISEGDFNWE